MTPLQLGAMVSAIANGGTLYYLQHPTSPDEIANFQPRIKRQLDIAPLIPEISVGMAGAVQYGTARRLGLNFNEEEILGKTGTCSHAGTRFGWFASYANTSADASSSLFSCRAAGLRSVRKRLRLPDSCTAISTITTSSSRPLPRTRRHRDPQARRHNRSRSYLNSVFTKASRQRGFCISATRNISASNADADFPTGDCGSTNLETSNTGTADAADMQCRDSAGVWLVSASLPQR